jgi:hypothetical protein
VRGWRAALLLVVLACATPGRASAECGDHVLILNQPTARADQGGHAAPASDAPAAPPRAPCSGPNCSQGSDRHPAPFTPASPPGPHGKEVAQLLESVEQPDGLSVRACDFLSSRPIRRVSAVFHPPPLG